LSNNLKRQKLLLAGLTILLVLATLIAYSPVLNNTPLFDESYLLAWLSHCLHSGFTAADTSAFLMAAPADPRDGINPIANLQLLIAAMLTGTSYQLLRWWQIILHIANAILVGMAVHTAMHVKQDGDEEQEKTFANRQSIIVSFSSSLIFALFPLAPEATSWLFALPVESALTFGLAATVLLLHLLRQDETYDKRNRSVAIIWTYALGFLALVLSLKAALLFLLPLALYVTLLDGQRGDGASVESKKQNQTLALSVIGAFTAVSLLVHLITFQQNNQPLPETLQSLKIEKISQDQSKRSNFIDEGPGANLQAIILPVNRNIDTKYNKVLRFLYFFLPVPVVFFLLACLTGRRFRMLALSITPALLIAALGCSSSVDSQNFYGARWLYPVLPAAAIFWALLCSGPLFINFKNFKNSRGRIYQIAQCALAIILLLLISVFFFQRTYRQNLSYKSNGKLWQAIKKSVGEAGRKETSPYIIVRGLPQSLSIAPILSPFSPQLIDSQSGLPRTTSLSGGKLKDALKNGKFTSLAMHYEKQWIGFAATDLKIVDVPFGPQLNAVKIGRQLSPPLQYYQGAVKFDTTNENLLLASHGKAGPALSMTAYGLSPINDDFLYVEAKIDLPGRVPDHAQDQVNNQSSTNSYPLELHWLTNWQGDWDGRDRKVITVGPAGDGQYHRYYFPLRTLAWTTSGLPTNLMLGFPANSTVALKSIGLGHEPMPTISAEPVHKQNSNKNYFSHYCFNYPDNEDLGLCAVYGRDNALDVKYDVSTVPGAAGAMIEIGNGSEIFRNENSTYPGSQTPHFDTKDLKGNLKIATKDFVAGVKSVRVFALDAKGKITGHSSDSLKCLIDPSL